VGDERMRFREARQLRNGGFINVNLSAEGIARLCQRILITAEMAGMEWEVETA